MYIQTIEKENKLQSKENKDPWIGEFIKPAAAPHNKVQAQPIKGLVKELKKGVDRDKKRFVQLYQEISQLCEDNGWGDPFSYAKGKEILAALQLNHTPTGPGVNSGADAYNESGDGVEYKSTTQGKVKGSYTGVSVQPTWADQVRYLWSEKIACYSEHYYNRFDVNGTLIESWMIPGEKVYEILLPKFESKWATIGSKKDPRLSAIISNRDIMTHGRKVYPL